MFYKETNFKETPIGKIPKDWEVVKLSDKAEVVSGFGFPLDYQGKRSGKYPFIKVNDLNLTQKYVLTADNFIDDEDLKALRAKVFPPNTIIFPKIGMAIYLNKFRVLKTWGTFDNNIAGVIPKEINPEFLFYYFQGKIDLKQLSGRTTAPSIRKTTLELILIPYPSLQEQQKIAEILSTVDETIQKANEIIAKTERLKKGLMQELLTKGIGHKEFKDTEIGRIPKDWEIVKLGDVLELCQYGLSIPLKEKGKYPIVRMDEIVNGYITPNVAKYVDLDEETFEKFKLEKGDILFNRTNAPDLVGRTGIFLLEGNYVFASYLIRLRVKREIFDPHFLTFYLIFSEERLKQLATRAVHQANINATNLKNLKIPRPAIEEQRKIVEILSTVDKKLEVERNEKAKLEKIKQGLMDLLLSGKIRVKVN